MATPPGGFGKRFRFPRNRAKNATGVASSPASRGNGCGVNWRGVRILCLLGTLTGVHTSMSQKGEGGGGALSPPPPPPACLGLVAVVCSVIVPHTAEVGAPGLPARPPLPIPRTLLPIPHLIRPPPAPPGAWGGLRFGRKVTGIAVAPHWPDDPLWCFLGSLCVTAYAVISHVYPTTL